jgi:GNAT superfamily N-acetyltransferase
MDAVLRPVATHTDTLCTYVFWRRKSELKLEIFEPNNLNAQIGRAVADTGGCGTVQLHTVEIAEKHRFKGYGKLIIEALLTQFDREICRVHRLYIPVETHMPIIATRCYRSALAAFGMQFVRIYCQYMTYDAEICAEDVSILNPEQYERLPESERRSSRWKGTMEFEEMR